MADKMADAACTPSAPRVNITTRISNIPIYISRDDLQKYLQELDSPLGTIAVNTAGEPYISLAPEASEAGHLRFQVATVTFSRLIYLPPSGVKLGPAGATFEATVDTHFRGLTPLNNPQDPTIDIIAVTGLAGHAFGSWRSREGYGMWLRDFLPSDMEDSYRAKIFTYGYDTTLIGSHSHAGIDHFSQQFIEAVKVARSKCSSRPLILIGHSLGGLVIKEAIIQCFDNKDSTLSSVAGILFFSVPHKGLADASLLFMVHGQPNENLVRDLCGNTQFLRGLDRSFGYHMNLRGMGTNIISFYETDETPTVKEVGDGKWGRSGPCVRMVTQESVKHAAGGGQDFPMDANHSSIVKFADRSDQKYQLVRSKLLGIARTILTALPEAEVPCEERIKFCEWVYPGVVDKKHKEICGKRQEETGSWLLADDKFTSWRDGSGPRLLWGCGIPGAGKTFLSSLVVDVLDARSRACSSSGLAYIYFDYMDQDQQVPVTVLRSLIRQLVSRPNFPIPKPVQSLYDQNRAPGTTPSLEDLRSALAATLTLFTETFFVFDALDECREDIRKQLLSLIHWIAASGTKIFLTSRPYQEIAASLTPTALNSHTERLELAAKEEDVMIYVEKTIQDHDDARDLIKTDFRADVVSRLVKTCKGMFLLVDFYIKDLCQYTTTAEIRSALEGISTALGAGKALHETYGRVMDSIWAQHASRSRLALKALTWLLTAGRTLTVDELRMAVAMGDGSRLGNLNPFNETEMPGQSLILSVCRGLVMIDNNSYTIKLVHFSVHEYLEKTCALGDYANRHLTVALGLLDHVWLSYIEPDPRRDCLRSSDGLMDYAQQELHTHMQACHHIAPIETLHGFLRSRNLVGYLGRLRWAPWRVYSSALSWPDDSHAYGPLHEATAWGSTVLANRLLSDGTDISHAPGAYTPLHVAAVENLVDLVRFWLEKGVGVNTTDRNRETPLSCAINRGSIDSARELLSSGADAVMAVDALGWWSAGGRNVNMLELLFEFGLSVEHKVGNEAYLVHAIKNNYSAVVELLLRKGARIHVRDRLGRTVLHEVAGLDKTDIACMLLQHGYGGHGEEEENEDKDEDDVVVKDRCCYCGDSNHRTPAGRLVDARDCMGQTPLHVAAVNKNPDMLRVLLSHGMHEPAPGTSSGHPIRAPREHKHAAAINARDHRGFTTLTRVYYPGHEHRAVMAQLLVDAGADLTVTPGYGGLLQTWLHAAGREGDAALLKAALDAGVDPHARGDDNESPLHSAASGTSVEAVSLLIEEGLSVDLRDRKGQTPLHYARGAATIALLLERGACTGSTDTSGNSPLHSRLYNAYNWDEGNDKSSEKLREEVQLLVDAGADVNARNNSGTTPLHLAARMGYTGPVSLLLESGADMGALDVNQMSAMHHAATSGGFRSPHAISVLVEKGLSIEARDIKQRTPLHYAARESSFDGSEEKIRLLCRLLVEQGASLDPRDSDGYTPLIYLITNDQPLSLVSLLVEAGADVNTVNNSGMSLLHLAAQKRDQRLLDLLMDAGADIHAYDSKQRTPLHYAVIGYSQYGLYSLGWLYTYDASVTAKMLVSMGADVNALDEDRNSPLHLAAQIDEKELLVLLLDAGTDRHARNCNQQTPLDIAIGCGLRADLTEMLVDRPSENCPANKAKTGDAGVEVVEIMDDACCSNETPGQYLGEKPTRKRRYSIAFLLN